MLRRKEKQKKIIKKYHFHTKIEHVQNKEKKRNLNIQNSRTTNSVS